MISSKIPVKVITVDDDPAMTDLLSMLLKGQGYEVMVANTAGDALRIIKEDAPDLILLDLMMPEMNGWQLCIKVREFSNTPILILSALDSPGMVASALDAGADDYLIKPVPSSILLAHLQNLTRRMVHPAGARFSVRSAVATS